MNNAEENMVEQTNEIVNEQSIETQEATPIEPLDNQSDTNLEEEVRAEKLSGVSVASYAEEKIRQSVIAGENALNPEEKTTPSFFISNSDTEVIEVDVLTHPQTGRVMSVTKAGYGIDFETQFAYFVHSVLRFEFSVPNYIQLAEYRRRCTSIDEETDKSIVDRVKLREFLLVNHLKKWNLTDKHGKEMPIILDKNGMLSDVSLVMVHSLVPAIMDVVFTVFEKDVLLI